jgi:ribosome-interacting GTPase 1
MKTDVVREKYIRLMTEIEDLENSLEKFEKKGSKKAGNKKSSEKSIEWMKERLAEKRNELARISDGCGTPHAH